MAIKSPPQAAGYASTGIRYKELWYKIEGTLIADFQSAVRLFAAFVAFLGEFWSVNLSKQGVVFRCFSEVCALLVSSTFLSMFQARAPRNKVEKSAFGICKILLICNVIITYQLLPEVDGEVGTSKLFC